MKTRKTTKKDKRIFWAGALAGIIGGFVGNLYAGYLFRFSDDITNKRSILVNLTGTIIYTLIFFSIIYFANKQININK